MTMIPYAGYDPSEGKPWGSRQHPMPSKMTFAWTVMDMFDRGFDSARIAAFVRAPEHVVAKTIEQGREMRRC